MNNLYKSKEYLKSIDKFDLILVVFTSSLIVGILTLMSLIVIRDIETNKYFEAHCITTDNYVKFKSKIRPVYNCDKGAINEKFFND